jgi:hypothetical protein
VTSSRWSGSPDASWGSTIASRGVSGGLFADVAHEAEVLRADRRGQLFNMAPNADLLTLQQRAEKRREYCEGKYSFYEHLDMA